MHTLVCGGHEFRNAAAFGGGGEQTVARTSCVGLIGSIISCVFGAVNRPQIRNFFLHPSLQHLPRLAAGIWERHTRGLFKRLPQFAAGFQLVNLLVGQRAAAVCVHNHVNGSFRGCIGCYHAKLRNAFLRSLERLLCGGFRAGRYRFRFGGYGVFRGRRYRFCLLHIRVHGGILLRFTQAIHAAADERASGRADCASQCAAQCLLPKFGKAKGCIRVSGQNVEAVVCCILRGFLPAFAESLTRHCPQYAGAAASNQFRTLFKRELIGHARDSTGHCTAKNRLVKRNTALFQFVHPVAGSTCAHQDGNENRRGLGSRGCCRSGGKELRHTADGSHKKPALVVQTGLRFLGLFGRIVQDRLDHFVLLGSDLVFSPNTLCACNAVKHLLEFRRSDRAVRSVSVGPAHLNESVPLLVGFLQVVRCCLILRDVHAGRLPTNGAKRCVSHIGNTAAKTCNGTKFDCACTACQRVHAQRGGIGVMLVLQLPVFPGFGLSLLLKLPHTLVCCGQTCIQLLCREVLLCHSGPGFGSGFLFCCRCLRGLDAA